MKVVDYIESYRDDKDYQKLCSELSKIFMNYVDSLELQNKEEWKSITTSEDKLYINGVLSYKEPIDMGEGIVGCSFWVKESERLIDQLRILNKPLNEQYHIKFYLGDVNG